MMYKINVSISYDHPTRGPLFHDVGETADLADWPDLDKLTREGTITPLEASVPSEELTIVADGAVDSSFRRKPRRDSDKEI